MRAWDMRPYAPQNRCVKVFTGHQHSFERNSLRCDWSPDGTKVGSWALLLSWSALSCRQHETATPNTDQIEVRCHCKHVAVRVEFVARQNVYSLA